jgi:hypothetical protein
VASGKDQKGGDQIKRFRETARALECDEDEGRFDEALKRVAKAPTPANESKPKKPG